MGAWGAGPFQDDVALDWLEEPFMASGVDAVRDALTHAMNFAADAYLEYDEGVTGRAAAEVVAAAWGRPDPSDDEEDLAKIARYEAEIRALPDLRISALKAVTRIAGSNSEIAELWLESESRDEWTASIASLTERLGADK